MLTILFFMQLMKHTGKQKQIKIWRQGNNSFIDKIGGKI